jgi:signal transduction histidine kinase
MRADVYLMIHQALMNAARHAGASVPRLALSALSALGLGPITHNRRVDLLGGIVRMDSSPGATRPGITFPVRRVRG